MAFTQASSARSMVFDSIIAQAQKNLMITRELGDLSICGNSIADKFSMFCIMPIRLVLDQGINHASIQKEPGDIFVFISNCN